MKKLENYFYIFDNGGGDGTTFDRYTIIRKRIGDIYGANSEPFSSFGQYCGNVTERAYNYGTIANYVKNARKNSEWLGKEVKDFSSLSPSLLVFLEKRI